MKKQMKNPVRNRKALTLIELVVVMTILIALAGLLIPTFAAMLTRGHTSTCSTNIGEVCKAIQQYQQLYGGYPSNMDALSDGTNVINYLANGAALPVSNGGPGTWRPRVAVRSRGLRLPRTRCRPCKMPVLPPCKAWPPHGQGPVPVLIRPSTTIRTMPPPGSPPRTRLRLAAGTVVGGLDPTAIPAAATRCQQLNLPVTGRYVVLGVGSRCSMVGKTMASAPVHFGDTPVLNPEFGYERLCGVFEISDTNNPNFTTAILVGVGPIHNDGLGSSDDELRNWYQLQQNGT